MRIVSDSVISKFESLIDLNYWNKMLGVARSSLALSLLLTLLFNTNEVLFTTGINNEVLPSLDKYPFLNLYALIENFTTVKVLSIIILMIVILGIYPRYTCVFHWWVTFSFFNTSLIIDGGDQINNILTLLLIPVCLTDQRRSHWSSPKSDADSSFYAKTIAFFSFIIIELQIAFLYFQASVGKFKVPEWGNGTAVYYWFRHQSYGMNDTLYPLVISLLKNPFIIAYTTWGVLLFELFLCSCIFFKNTKIRKTAWYLGILFHFGIIVIHGLFSFFFAMLGALTLYLAVKKAK